MSAKKSFKQSTVAYCYTSPNRTTPVEVLRHKTTGKIYIEGDLLALYKPRQHDEDIIQHDAPATDENGMFTVGRYRATSNSHTYACSGVQLQKNHLLEQIFVTDYDTAMGILHGSRNLSPKIIRLLDETRPGNTAKRSAVYGAS